LHEWGEILLERNLCLSVNLTRRQLFNLELIPRMAKSLAASDADPSRLAFEVPETALNEAPDAAVAALQRLADC